MKIPSAVDRSGGLRPNLTPLIDVIFNLIIFFLATSHFARSEPTETVDLPTTPVVLLTGATGYIGGRRLPLLEQQPVIVRCLARNPDKLRASVKESTQVVRGWPWWHPPVSRSVGI